MRNTEDNDTFSIDDIRQQISAFSAGEMAFLMKYATIYASGTGKTPEDMLHDCFVKFLSGVRNAPRSCRLTTTLKNAMRSLADNERRIHDREEKWISKEPTSTDDNDWINPLENVAGDDPPIEGEIEGDQLVKVIEKHLSGDDIVMQVIDARFHGQTKAETCTHQDISSREYDAAVKRMRRAIERHY